MSQMIGRLVEMKDWKRKYAGLPEPKVLAESAGQEFYNLYRLRRELTNNRFQFELYDDPFAAPEIHRMANQLNKFMGFGRGDVNNDDEINLSDVIYTANYVNYSGPGPIPFKHLGDVDADGDIDNADIMYLVNYYFGYGAGPLGAMMNKI